MPPRVLASGPNTRAHLDLNDLCVVAVLMKFCEVPFLLLSTSI